MQTPKIFLNFGILYINYQAIFFYNNECGMLWMSLLVFLTFAGFLCIVKQPFVVVVVPTMEAPNRNQILAFHQLLNCESSSLPSHWAIAVVAILRKLILKLHACYTWMNPLLQGLETSDKPS